ncbi:MAG: class I SAM-dependent methyltransferase, partial [Thermoleophilaceae bacterium]
MLESSAARILANLGSGDLVLDVGAGANPFERADWVIDLWPYGKRGIYGRQDRAAERFSEATWVLHDICDPGPWPFADDQFDFAVCSHTLEDVRDPVGVCAELSRVARAGYIEVPSRLEEQSLGVQGPWAGWGHHHWLIDPIDG